MTRTEPCACGDSITVTDPTPQRIQSAMRRHQRSPMHQAWSGPDRTDVPLEPMWSMDASSFERMFHVLVDEVRGYVTSNGIVPASTMGPSRRIRGENDGQD